MATFNNASLLLPRALISSSSSTNPNPRTCILPPSSFSKLPPLVSAFRCFNSLSPPHFLSSTSSSSSVPSRNTIRAAVDGEYSSSSSRRNNNNNNNSNNNEPRETILLPGCDYNHWLIVMEFPKDPTPTRDQMIDTYLNTLATVLGSMEEAKQNMYAFSTTTYTGFQCTVDEETSEKFKGLPGVLWVLPDSYIDVKNKDYGGDKYINGEIIPCKYPTYQPKQRSSSKYESRRYERKKDGPPPQRRKPTQGAATPSDSSSPR